ncbi:hypothetical protein BEL04_01635 [Mucilaginibacter sp. PPCGB 2223]|uniref:DUF3826 domain-containing protein n=1 Tax=Mucilaginibacter sp. PPCGB 2223 TaxID=1886027 RepID=UPI0008247489|nr:DUF3826 domain-containing protein [Mucilaginibacter sp. PPCGB 2223]OCX53042.1 hypothetical protein BEL04_01635 [Mucilaginibacter sp. PPCGB 2223]
MNKFFTLFLIVTVLTVPVFAQKGGNTPAGQDANYAQVITARAAKIVDALGISDSVKYKRVQAIIVDQYRSLSSIHDTRNAQVKDIKAQASADKDAANAKIKSIDDDVDARLGKLHSEYLSKLNTELTPAQTDQVKDAMTYRIMPITYKAYTEEVLTLTDVQKAQIKTWLLEARELAIDAESSDKKHAVFNKYKGRINNYLSAQGYDMKKEGEEWQKRIKEKAQPKDN